MNYVDNWEKTVLGRGRKGKSAEAEMCLEDLKNCKVVSVAIVEQGMNTFN